MKKILFLFCLVNVLNTSAQDVPEIDDRLLFRFTQSQLDDIASVNPNQIKYLNFYLNNSYYFQDIGFIPNQKLQDYQDVFQLLSLPFNISNVFVRRCVLTFRTSLLDFAF